MTMLERLGEWSGELEVGFGFSGDEECYYDD